MNGLGLFWLVNLVFHIIMYLFFGCVCLVVVVVGGGGPSSLQTKMKTAHRVKWKETKNDNMSS